MREVSNTNLRLARFLKLARAVYIVAGRAKWRIAFHSTERSRFIEYVAVLITEDKFASGGALGRLVPIAEFEHKGFARGAAFGCKVRKFAFRPIFAARAWGAGRAKTPVAAVALDQFAGGKIFLRFF